MPSCFTWGKTGSILTDWVKNIIGNLKTLRVLLSNLLFKAELKTPQVYYLKT